MGGSFDPNAGYVPAGLKKPVKEALAAGWTPAKKRIGTGGWYIYSPKKSDRFYVPSTCRDADELAKILRSKISKSYLSEPSAFGPDFSKVPGAVESLSSMADLAIGSGALLIPGPDPMLGCPDCDATFEGWEAFALHQDECRANRKTAVAAKQPREVPEEGGETDRPSEDVSQDVTDSTESVHSGTISTKEETPLATESTTPTPKPGPKTAPAPKPEINPETGRKQGYKWTQVKGRENPLHEILYEAVRMNRRFRDETDSKYTKRLADYIEGEGLLGRLPDADPDVQAAYVLSQIRELLGGGEVEGPDEAEIEQFKKDIIEKDEQIEALNKKVTEMSDFFSTMSEMAKEVKK